MLLHTEILDEWVDCRGVSSVPCLAVTVNLTRSNQKAFLHFDEESVMLAPKVRQSFGTLPFGSLKPYCIFDDQKESYQ